MSRRVWSIIDPVMSNYEKYGFKGIAEKPYTASNLQLIVDQVIRN